MPLTLTTFIHELQVFSSLTTLATVKQQFLLTHSLIHSPLAASPQVSPLGYFPLCLPRAVYFILFIGVGIIYVLMCFISVNDVYICSKYYGAQRSGKTSNFSKFTAANHGETFPAWQ